MSNHVRHRITKHSSHNSNNNNNNTNTNAHLSRKVHFANGSTSPSSNHTKRTPHYRIPITPEPRTWHSSHTSPSPHTPSTDTPSPNTPSTLSHKENKQRLRSDSSSAPLVNKVPIQGLSMDERLRRAALCIEDAMAKRYPLLHTLTTKQVYYCCVCMCRCVYVQMRWERHSKRALLFGS